MGFAGSKTQKEFRKYEHSAERNIVKRLLKTEQYESIPHPKEYGNEWASPRDGKQWLSSDDTEYMRK